MLKNKYFTKLKFILLLNSIFFLNFSISSCNYNSNNIKENKKVRNKDLNKSNIRSKKRLKSKSINSSILNNFKKKKISGFLERKGLLNTLFKGLISFYLINNSIQFTEALDINNTNNYTKDISYPKYNNKNIKYNKSINDIIINKNITLNKKSINLNSRKLLQTTFIPTNNLTTEPTLEPILNNSMEGILPTMPCPSTIRDIIHYIYILIIGASIVFAIVSATCCYTCCHHNAKHDDDELSSSSDDDEVVDDDEEEVDDDEDDDEYETDDESEYEEDEEDETDDEGNDTYDL